MIKISKWIGAITVIVGFGWAGFSYFAYAEESHKKSSINAEAVAELHAIHVRQDTADSAKAALIKEMCLNGKLQDVDDCAKVGVDVR